MASLSEKITSGVAAETAAVASTSTGKKTENRREVFRAIIEFVNNLDSYFTSTGKLDKPFTCYHYLITNPRTVKSERAVNKHIGAFRLFLSLNNVLSRNTDEIKGNVVYSARAYIDVKTILKNSTEENQKTIWDHMLNISYHFDPYNPELKETLKKVVERNATSSGGGGDGGAETKFIGGLFSTLLQKVDTSKPSSPADAIKILMAPNVIGDILTTATQGFNDGSLNINRLMGTIQGMIGNMGNGEAFMGAMGAMGNQSTGGSVVTQTIITTTIPSSQQNLHSQGGGPVIEEVTSTALVTSGKPL